MVSVPSIWSDTLPIIAVAACDNLGNVPDWAQWNAPREFPYSKASIFAPGVDVVNADPDPSEPDRYAADDGASICEYLHPSIGIARLLISTQLWHQLLA